MPSYKVDVIKRFGKLHYGLWKAGEPKPDILRNKPYDNIDVLIDDLKKDVQKTLAPEDPLIFRQIAYEDRNELYYEMKRADY